MLNSHSIKTGLSFGITSAVITTLGLMVGLNASTNSKLVVVGGILIIAIADSLSDAFGVHISEESEGKHTAREVWESTIYTFLTKFFFALIFVIPILLLGLQVAIVVNIIIGALLIIFLSYFISHNQKTKTWRVIVEHLLIATLVIILTHYLGTWIRVAFG